MQPSRIPHIIELQRRGDLAAADALCTAALAQAPDDAELIFLRALGLHLQQRLDEALPLYRRLADMMPDSPEHWSNYATAAAQLRRLDESEAAWSRVAALNPRDPTPCIQLGLAAIERRDYLAARERMLDAFERDRDSPDTRIHAARACSLAQDFRGAEDLLAAWRNWLPLADETMQLELARQLHLLGRAPDGSTVLAELVARKPRSIEARVQLARAEERMNKVDEAERLTAAIDLTAATPAQHAEIMQLRALLLMRRRQPAQARALLEQAGPSHPMDYAHFYELARACDQQRDSAAAMHALRSAHALQTEELRYVSPDCFGPGAPALPGEIRTVNAEQYARWPTYRAPDSRDSPLFVVGFPRSGTTLLEQMLDAHPHLQSMDENPYFERLAAKLRAHDRRILDDLSVLRQYDCDELRKQYWLMVEQRIERRAGAQVVDKNPLNVLWLPFIHRLFPNARFILCVRHPCDVMLSCYMQNFRSVILAAACENLGRLAHAYVQAMDCWLRHAEVFALDAFRSRYEDLIADPPGQAQRLARFLGLADAAPMLAFDQRAREKGFIATPSYSQVIEPINSRAMGRWHRYREYFEPELPTLAPMLQAFGYDSSCSSAENRNNSGTNGA